MTIETKFNPKDVVWFMKDNKVESQGIWNIIVNVSEKKEVDIIYAFFKSSSTSHVLLKEKEVFPTKESLLQTL